MTATTLLLIRHGQSAHNAEGRWQGQSDVPLSPLGRQQADLLAARLAPRPPDAIYASDLQRAFATAQAIAERCGCPLMAEPRLREIHIGQWSNLTSAEIRSRFPDDWQRYEADRDGGHRRGVTGESAQQVTARVREVISEIVARHPGQRVVIVSHGFALRSYLARLLGIPFPRWYRLQVANCGISEVRVDGEAVSVVRVNDHGHLEGSAP